MPAPNSTLSPGPSRRNRSTDDHKTPDPGLELQLHDALVDLLVQQLDATLGAAAMVDWATAALCEDYDTPALVILAGLARDSSRFDVEPWLAKALAELGVEAMTPEMLRRAYVGVVSRALVARTVTCVRALDLIHSRAVQPLGHPPDLQPWCFVWEGLAPSDFRSLNTVEVEHEALSLATVWAQHAPVIQLKQDNKANL